MELTQMLFISVALIATAGGFPSPRKSYPGFFTRPQKRFGSSMSVRTSLSRGPRRMTSPGSGTKSSSINQRFSINRIPHGQRPINIFSNIILNHGSKPPQGGNNNNGNNGKRPSKGQGQGRGQGRRGRHGNNNSPYNIFNGNNNGNNNNGGPFPHGFGNNGENGAGQIHPGAPSHSGNHGNNNHGNNNHGNNNNGNNNNGFPFSPGSGIGSLLQLTLPMANYSGLHSLLAGQNIVGGAGALSKGAKSQVVILPNGPNTGTLVLSADPGLGFHEIRSTAGGGGALIVEGEHKEAGPSRKHGGFYPGPALKPGEDPPEIEGPQM